MKIRLIFFVLVSIAVVTASCNSKPKGVLREGDMVDMIADIETAEAYVQTQGASFDEETRERLMTYILEKRGITKEEFDSTMTWYGKNIDEYQKLFEKVDKELAVRQKKATGSADDVQTNDLWPYSRHMLIDENSATDNLTFSIPVTDLEKGSTINLKMRLRSASGGDALLGVDYENGSTAYISQSAMGNRKIELSVQSDTGKVVRRIYGYFHITADIEKPMWIDSISLSSQPYDSTKYYQISRLRNYNGPHRKIQKTESDSLSNSSDSIAAPSAMPQASPVPRPHAMPLKPSNANRIRPDQSIKPQKLQKR